MKKVSLKAEGYINNVGVKKVYTARPNTVRLDSILCFIDTANLDVEMHYDPSWVKAKLIWNVTFTIDFIFKDDIEMKLFKMYFGVP